MAAVLFANNATTTLASTLSDSATSCDVASGTGALFPSPTSGQYFMMTFTDAATGLINEIVKVTARTGDTMTIVRAQEGTVAVAWAIGDTAANLWTAGQAATLVQQSQLQIQATNYGADSGTKNAAVVTLSPVPASLTEIIGAPIRVKKMAAANDGAITLNVNSLGAIPITTTAGAAVGAGLLLANTIFEVFYNGTSFTLTSTPAVIAPGGAASGDLTGTYPGPTITNGAVSNVKMADMAALTIKGNDGGSAAAPQDLSVAEVLALIGVGANSIATNGYYTLPGGLILQWGHDTTAQTPEATVPITLPVAFPNNAFMCGGNVGYNTTRRCVLSVISLTTTTATFLISNVGGSGTVPGFYWWAIGN